MQLSTAPLLQRQRPKPFQPLAMSNGIWSAQIKSTTLQAGLQISIECLHTEPSIRMWIPRYVAERDVTL
ncbi:hypothetical protein BAUCODRAFT_35477 [Baudoinia panamericana UAMH 10762]|uniref:Uncharacterized protein n=1 Tax=Baudoinia panamericana (strain UAMH 10762) TaxID=717646 RepID=M2N9M6_BAUPA|nr:uncharacterized protein BAUCODRAFT_35477 [Baudoinia panamericana UAMH 10762]EMC95495.1 hypothetical protein BAUCODRAFT_35477 [Baudoinia panamericana UAMH 10762]